MFKERIRKIRKELNLTQKLFAKQLGVAQITIQRYETGRSLPDATFLEKLTQTFRVNPTWLLTGEGEMFLPSGEKQEIYASEKEVKEIIENHPQVVQVKAIPVINIQVPAGYPEIPLQEEQVIDYLYLPLNDVPSNATAIQVKGNSMYPTIKDGEFVVFEPNPVNIHNGDIVIVRNEWNELILKRYRVKDGEIFLVSDNPEYPTIKPNENYKIVGKVLRCVSVRKP